MAELINLSPTEAFTFLEKDKDAIHIDVRSSMEFLFVGHPVGAIHIAWIDEPDWEINPTFVSEVAQALNKKLSVVSENKGSPIILICRSGKRSKLAGELLLDSGFTHVAHINEGFEGEQDEKHHRGSVGGWRFHQLPWEQC